MGKDRNRVKLVAMTSPAPKVLLAALAAALTASSCRTTSHGGSAGQGAADANAALTDGAGLEATMELTKDEEQALYLQMLDVELQNGV